jgi:hypothetical protein
VIDKFALIVTVLGDAQQVSQQEVLSNLVTNVPRLVTDGNVDDSDLKRILNEVPLADYSTTSRGN